jgi:hypothetical protein
MRYKSSYICDFKEDKEMTFTAYVQRQKNLIRGRHVAETFLIVGGDVILLNADNAAQAESCSRSTEDILKEIDGMKGLNTHERAAAGRRGRVERSAVC